MSGRTGGIVRASPDCARRHLLTLAAVDRAIPTTLFVHVCERTTSRRLPAVVCLVSGVWAGRHVGGGGGAMLVPPVLMLMAIDGEALWRAAGSRRPQVVSVALAAICNG